MSVTPGVVAKRGCAELLLLLRPTLCSKTAIHFRVSRCALQQTPLQWGNGAEGCRS